VLRTMCTWREGIATCIPNYNALICIMNEIAIEWTGGTKEDASGAHVFAAPLPHPRAPPASGTATSLSVAPALLMGARLSISGRGLGIALALLMGARPSISGRGLGIALALDLNAPPLVWLCVWLALTFCIKGGVYSENPMPGQVCCG